jgi:hypothetical protein
MSHTAASPRSSTADVAGSLPLMRRTREALSNAH